MKQDQVKIGETYKIKVGDHKDLVVVVARVETTAFCSKRLQVKFRCRSVTTGKDLPKLRLASAIHEVTE